MASNFFSCHNADQMWYPGLKNSLLLLTISMMLFACQVHDVLVYDQPPVTVPEVYEFDKPAEESVPRDWWSTYKSDELDEVVSKVLANNYDLKQAWSRLAQADQLANIEGSAKVPSINLTHEFARIDSKGPITSPLDFTLTRYLLGGALYYEIDLWNRIHSRSAAAWLNADATFEEVESTALMLSGRAVDLWFQIQEERDLLLLYAEQVKINKTFLELIELRFSIGDASALDVFQQRLQLSQTESQIPPAESRLQLAKNELSILMGEPPDVISKMCYPKVDVELPPFPETKSPADLLYSRPDLRALQYRLISADYEVAAAIADRFPKLTLNISYDFSGDYWKHLFETQTSQIMADLILPLVDGGRRRAEVERRKAVVIELLDNFAQTFLNALGEVENAIVQENYQVILIEHLVNQEKIAKQNLAEARSRYATGLNDYLPVIAAITSLQLVERRIITEHSFLLRARARLYQALGGYHLAEYPQEEILTCNS